MKRRVVKVGDRRYQVTLPGGDVSEFSYKETPRKWNPDLCTYVDFESDEDRYVLSWEGLFMDSFPSEEEVLLFIIRFGYSVGDDALVPSELLADFDLVYEAGDWVDEWYCPDQHEVIFALGEIQKPDDRNIRFEGYPRITPRREWQEGTYFDETGAVHTYSHTGHYSQESEVVAEIEIPELDFEKLEEPKTRRREISRKWSDTSDPGFEAWMGWKLDIARRKRKRDRLPDAECVFTLQIGKKAEKAHEARKKKAFALHE